MSVRARLACLACAGTLAACSPASEAQVQTQAENDPAPAAQDDVFVQQTPDNCLLLVWQEQETRDEQFDLANDHADGGAISCATGTSASQFDQALAAIRAAARSQNKAAILEEVGLPLLYIDAAGERRELTRSDDVDATFAEVFDDDVLALLREVDLDALTVVPEQGAFVELGSVWLVVDRSGGRPRIVTVNKQALGEAAMAVRDEAEAGGGETAPARRSRRDAEPQRDMNAAPATVQDAAATPYRDPN
ncbi:hypothetical protein [Alteriqipengyuania lutimaris]|uniref:hypothetical protein n=1 Tax=Alteriqipengyuania lutimaris TaxID=1538146 RepID=UPI0017EA355E|nr:hypothetical protein [Alteriqipengyuania lutimaris]MBB3035271.1 hypothetical protein [Alteriqipengyuania lutimaris]